MNADPPTKRLNQEIIMTKILLTVLALAAFSSTSFAGMFGQYSRDNAGFSVPGDHNGGDRGGDRGGR